MSASAFRYRAFISYSHSDQAVVRWLHRALETYRVPKRLIGRETQTGTITKRLGAVFRDRDELPVSADLSGKINEALTATQFLIVLCSPAAATSKWVNQEVINFKRLKGEDSIIAVIVGGEPYASSMPGRAAEECFVPALRFRVAADGTVTDQPAEPIAADLRAGKDSKRLVTLKVIAGLLGLGLDELVRRENQRRTQRLFWLSSGMAAAMVVMGALTVNAIQARNDAERQKMQAEDLIEFMLGDLRQKLEPVGRLDVLDSVGEKTLAYFASLKPGELDANTLGRKARALHLIGEIQDLRGNQDVALKVFEEASATTEALLERAPNDPQRLFEHAQSKYWVGYESWQRREFPDAEKKFREYQTLATRLTEIDPKNPKWRTELGHSYVNLGSLFLLQGRGNESLAEFEQAHTSYATVAALEPSDPASKVNLAQVYAWLADANLAVSRLETAQKNRVMEIALYDTMIANDPNNETIAESKLVALRALGQLALNRGEIGASVDRYHEAVAAAMYLTQRDPDNTFRVEQHASAELEYAESLQLAGRPKASIESLARARTQLSALIKKRPTVKWQVLLARAMVLSYANAATTGSRQTTVDDFDAALRTLAQLHQEHPDDATVSDVRAQAFIIAGDAFHAHMRIADARRSWTDAVEFLESLKFNSKPATRMRLAIAYSRLGDIEKAKAIAADSCRAGFRFPTFAALCSESNPGLISLQSH